MQFQKLTTRQRKCKRWRDRRNRMVTLLLAENPTLNTYTAHQMVMARLKAKKN
jgi:hypothetical protein